jgi:hypothetical protein
MAAIPSETALRQTLRPDAGPVTEGIPLDFARLERLRRLSWWLDTRWQVPGTRVRFGLDGLASVLPIVGDTATAALSVYLVAEAARFGLPRGLIVRMAGNILLDWAGGSIPIAGTVFDVLFKSNRRNLALLHEHLERHLG